MPNITVPTGRDIFIEVGGRRVAAVEGCKVHTTRELFDVETLGSALPAGRVAGQPSYRIELKRICLLDGDTDGFYNLSGFSVVMVRPDSRVLFTGCEWNEISEAVSAGEPLIETVTLLARRRTVN